MTRYYNNGYGWDGRGGYDHPVCPRGCHPCGNTYYINSQHYEGCCGSTLCGGEEIQQLTREWLVGRNIPLADREKVARWLELEAVWQEEVRVWLTAEREWRYQNRWRLRREEQERQRQAERAARQAMAEANEDREYQLAVSMGLIDPDAGDDEDPCDAADADRYGEQPMLTVDEMEAMRQAMAPVVTEDATVEVTVTVTVAPEPVVDMEAIRQKARRQAREQRKAKRVHVPADVRTPETSASKVLFEKMHGARPR